MGNIARISIDLSRIDYIPTSENVDLTHQLRFGDVLFNTRNTLELVGKVSIWRNELRLAFYNSNILRLRFKPEICGDSQYFGYALNAVENIKAIRNLATGTTTVAAIYTRDLLKLEVLVPSKAEQRSIAEALYDVDQHISALERMIAKKQAIKRGMMQELLSGRTRLPGFNGEWIEGVWGEFAEYISSGATPSRSRDAFWGGSIPWVTSTELKRGLVTRVPQKITEAGRRAANLQIWPAGTFVMAITGLEAAGTRGSCGVLGHAAATNQSCMVVVPSARLDTGYLFQYYLYYGEELALKYTQGTKQQSYTAGLVRELPIRLPEDVSEQGAIAGALSDAEEEVRALQVRLTKAHAIKQGMMQQLLTGRVRLPVEARHD